MPVHSGTDLQGLFYIDFIFHLPLEVAGRPWTLGWIFGLPGVGLGFRLWWCRKHGTDPLTAEPRERYHELRGWG